MKKVQIIFYSLLSFNVFGQDNPTERAQPIVEEGKRLYRSEMASWYGTDLFLEKYKKMENIGGYFSYTEGGISRCVFFSNMDQPKVIGAIDFDSTYNVNLAKVDLSEREFTEGEKDLYLIRKSAMNEINSDTLFKRFNNTNLNLIPLINENEKKVYVLTGPKENGVVIIGNDYLLTFDRNNKLLTKRRLHANIIPINYGGKEEEGKQIEGTMHTHLPETGEFITATDICTLMLYEKFTKWKSHNVVSKNYLNIWNCETNKLIVIPLDTIKKINKDDPKSNESKE